MVKLSDKIIRIRIKIASLSGCEILAQRPEVLLLNLNFYS